VTACVAFFRSLFHRFGGTYLNARLTQIASNPGESVLGIDMRTSSDRVVPNILASGGKRMKPQSQQRFNIAFVSGAKLGGSGGARFSKRVLAFLSSDGTRRVERARGCQARLF
jgi:hypothetical protein